MDIPSQRPRRLSLTKKQLQREDAESLLTLLADSVADGHISENEVERLKEWLTKMHSSDLPAVGFLREAIEQAIADGSLSDSDRLDIHLAIERVLPVTNRALSKEARKSADTAAKPAPKITRQDLTRMRADIDMRQPVDRAVSWRDNVVTEAQRGFLKSLGGTVKPGMTRGEASDLIDALLNNKPISSRQQMVMRFWGRERQPSEGPREISDWLDLFHEEDPDRKKAWELFKNESEDDGLQGDPMRVPFGIGPQFLERIKEGGQAAVPRFHPAARKDLVGPGLRDPFVVTVFAIAAGIGLYFIMR